ncbi:MAG: TIM barrel protein [Patescibacteria group bacterium]|nr:TIM barrel protein [Patescibacteria group bacterium]
MITFSTASLYPYGLNRIFEISNKVGFDGIEVMLRSKNDISYLDTWDAAYLKQLEIANKIKIVSLHVPFEFEEDQSSFDRIIKLAKQIKTRYVIIHTPREDQVQYNEWVKKTIIQNRALAEKYGILIENVHIKTGKANPVFKNIDDFKTSPAVCFDIAHALRSKQDPKLFIKSLDNIRQWHLSNWDGKDDHLSILEEKEKFSSLLNIGPAECICLELCPKAFLDIQNQEEIIDVLQRTLAFIRKKNIQQNIS